MESAGHTRVEMTMNTYGQVNLAAKREAMEAVGDLFEGPGGRSGVTVMGRVRPRSQLAGRAGKSDLPVWHISRRHHGDDGHGGLIASCRGEPRE